ncbi:hypothetical protein BC941DRAFT_49677 [Chlamydoabsidia padenii]|nr:hypothetical protein BC941DRAFT_49677 [Chlamydoabsidia padenii]
MVNKYDSGPNTSGQHEFYAPRTIPFMINDDDDENDYDYEHYHDTEHNNKLPIQATLISDHQQHDGQVIEEPTVTTAALAAQAILSETLEDLTEKLAFIRTNMMDIGSSTAKQLNSSNKHHDDKQHNKDNDDDNDDDTATLHTMKTIVNKRSMDRLSTSSDLDSITSEALHEYENTTTANRREQKPSPTTTTDYHKRRFSSNIGSDLHMPVSSTSYSQHSHPFAYFTEPVDDQDNTSNKRSSRISLNNDTTSGLQGAVLNFGRKWFG